MAAFAAFYHLTPADYWALTLDERAALADVYKATMKARKG